MPQITPIRGFTNTPVTKSICIVGTVVALALSILSLKQYVNPTIDPFVIQYRQYWRMATFQLSVVNESDYLLCTILWFHFKTLERFFGPRKYLSLVALFAIYNAAATFMVLCLGQLSVVFLAAVSKSLLWKHPFRLVYYDTIFNSVVPGPLGVLASLYMCHGTYIPVLYHFNVLLRKPAEPTPEVPTPERSENSVSADTASSGGAGGKTLTFTNHFQVHAIFTILMLNHGFKSLLPCLIGICIGRLYTHELLIGSKTWVLPTLIFQLFVAPRKVRSTTLRSLSRRWQGYQRVPQENITSTMSSPPVEDVQGERPEDEEESEVAIDDISRQEETVAARSTTPVRPLGRQFLDTFRS